MPTKGTKEWADSNINIQHGCYHGCKYCYAAQMGIRFKRFESLDEWVYGIHLNENNINKKYMKRKGCMKFG